MTQDLIRYWSLLVNESEDAESNNRFVEGFDKLSDANKEYALKILTLCMDKKKMKQHMELSEYRGTTQRDYEVFLKMLYDYKWNSTQENVNENSNANDVKKHFEEVIGDIVKEQVEEYSKKCRSVRKYKDYLIDFILERSEEIIEDAVEMEEYETDEQLAFFIQQNMDNFDEQFMHQNPSDFDEEGNWDSGY